MIARSFDRGARRYDELANVQHQVADKLLAMVFPQVQQAASIVDLGCGTGRLLAACRASNSRAQLIGVDISSKMLAQLAERKLDATLRKESLERTGLNANSHDLVLSSSAMQWADIGLALNEAARICATGGKVSIACFLHGTLASWRAIWGGNHQVMPDSQMIIDAAENAGLTMLNSRIETIVDQQRSFRGALASVKGIGAGGNGGQVAQFMGKKRLIEAEEMFMQKVVDEAAFPMEYEVLYLCAQKEA